MAQDNRQVVLLKSKFTLNRFYTLAEPERGWRNAEEIEDFPDDVILGIAYPCLEDGLNDFAVIRSTFETIDCFPDDEALKDDLMVMVVEARETLKRRLEELRDRLQRRQAHFLGTDLREFKEYAITLAVKGNIRRTLDNMMKLDVYKDVAVIEAETSGAEPETMYRYQFRPDHALEKIHGLPPLAFVVRMFNDVLDAVEDPASYLTKYTFDKEVFQKFIALMFVNYATTDPIFYGTNKADYGVSMDRDMSDTPLYKSVGEALREIERKLRESPDEEFALEPAAETGRALGAAASPASPGLAAAQTPEGAGTEASPFDRPTPAAPPAPEPFVPAQGAPMSSSSPSPEGGGRAVVVPNAATAEQRIMLPLNSITMAAELLKNSDAPMAANYAQMILMGAETLVATLREWGVLEQKQK